MGNFTKITYPEVEKVLKKKSWWALPLLPLAIQLTLLFARWEKITPNQITLGSFILSMGAGVAFLFHHWILGALLYQLGYILDIVDGALARVTGQTSPQGALFDLVTDWLKTPLVATALFWGEFTYLVPILILLYLNCGINRYNDSLFYQKKESVTAQLSQKRENLIGRYLAFMKEKNWGIVPGIVEVEALLFFFYPLFHHPIFPILGILLLLFQFLLKLGVVWKKITR